jgi:hypothetical protein
MAWENPRLVTTDQLFDVLERSRHRGLPHCLNNIEQADIMSQEACGYHEVNFVSAFAIGGEKFVRTKVSLQVEDGPHLDGDEFIDILDMSEEDYAHLGDMPAIFTDGTIDRILAESAAAGRIIKEADRDEDEKLPETVADAAHQAQLARMNFRSSLDVLLKVARPEEFDDAKWSAMTADERSAWARSIIGDMVDSALRDWDQLLD